MAPTTKEENNWDDKATAAAIAGARKVVSGSTPLMNTPVGRLGDQQWGWIVTGAIFGWVQTSRRAGDRRGHRSGAGRAPHWAHSISI